ncbi:hypothetical protein J4442_04375 [Candidatus Woesearchaeota archaeon]|nr:hypothetical protein [Candidatus Woesearchaeota archaeon]
MNHQERRMLYSIVGFFGGLIFINTILPNLYEYKLLFSIIGGLLAGYAGYKLAN